MTSAALNRFIKRMAYTATESNRFLIGGHRPRLVEHIAAVAARYSIAAEVVASRHCNAGHTLGQRMILDIDGNFITRLCPKRLCVYLVSQLNVPVALINERLSEGLAPNDFHFMRRIRCQDVGVECLGFGEVMLEVSVIPRIRA